MYLGISSTALTHRPGFRWCLLPHAGRFGAGRLACETWTSVCVGAHFRFVRHAETNPELKQSPAAAWLAARPERCHLMNKKQDALHCTNPSVARKAQTCPGCNLQCAQSSWSLSRKRVWVTLQGARVWKAFHFGVCLGITVGIRVWEVIT